MSAERRHEFDTAMAPGQAVEAAARLLRDVGYVVSEQSEEHLVARKGQDKVIAMGAPGHLGARAADLPQTVLVEAAEGLVSVTARVTVTDPQDPMVDLAVAAPLACLQLVIREGASHGDALTAYRIMAEVTGIDETANRRFRRRITVVAAVAAACVVAAAGLIFALRPTGPGRGSPPPASPTPVAPALPSGPAPSTP
ncbi:MAG: hypothetical protein KF678_06265 [Phycisphaeraceae bacterium]|nr:hypothetical protein [Phycisphaeraceae bacterium]